MGDEHGRGETRRIRVCSLNLWGLFGEWPARRRILCEAWPSIEADVLLVQEVRRNPGYDQLADIAQMLGYPHRAAAWSIDHAEDEVEGVAILSRHELMDVQSRLLPQSHPPRMLLSAHLFGASGQPLRVVCTHTVFHPEPVQDAQLKAVMAEACAHTPTIVGADLNASPARVSQVGDYSRLTDAHADDPRHTWPACDIESFRSAWRSTTGREPDFPIVPARLDYLLSSGLEVSAAQIHPLQGPEGMSASDHAAVVADYFYPPVLRVGGAMAPQRG